MTDFFDAILNFSNEGHINVYAVNYRRRNNDNIAYILPGNRDSEFLEDFCENLIKFKSTKAKLYDPTNNGIDEGTYEYIDISESLEIWQNIENLIKNADDFWTAEITSLRKANLYVAEVQYNGKKYYLLARQKQTSEQMLRGKKAIIREKDKIVKYIPKDKDFFVVSTYVDCVVDIVSKMILIVDKTVFKDIFSYDQYQKELVEKKIGIIDEWKFLNSTELIKKKKEQKYVYLGLAKVFADENYMLQIRNTSPHQLKKALLEHSNDNFTNADFIASCIIQSVDETSSSGY